MRRMRKPLVREDPHDVGAALHLPVQALQRVRGIDPSAVLGGEVHGASTSVSLSSMKVPSFGHLSRS